ncbi:hypothetical protein CB0940_03402 [Cercospora beticola]|uniref:DUF7605 domain-containing protein n=1 Tax=Cercospora beticola TaxID=122368 RepID=A0A2G5I2U7_CERBT|nr:hypothetical protein CB0940_03402 [Cercospora beticola]PIA99134.1 hypothetical protein CB0940_03402 [Cercospora beticola]WPB00577.1 hypothetical protein RHO25_005197 [Cercospora beticola]CAK1361204.1 unnamed protein product [Cercospora beticola]
MSVKRPHDEVDAPGDTKKTKASGVGDNSLVVPPYDAANEPMPDSPVFREDFLEIERLVRRLLHELYGPINLSKFISNVVNGLKEEFRTRTKSQCPEEVCIALNGAMQAGKTATANSILNKTIGKEGDEGYSCTWVTQEFCFKLLDQTKPYAAEVHFYGQEDRKALIRALLKSYREALSTTNDDAMEGKRDLTHIIHDHAVKQATVDAFMALLFIHDDFSTRENTELFLARADIEGEDEIGDELCDLTEDLMTELLHENEYVFLQGSTSQSLQYKLSRYMRTFEEKGKQLVSFWPLVSHIKFGLSNRLLRNISILDLPGITDPNKIRSENALNHLQRCTHCIVVGEIGRAADDELLRKEVNKSYFARGSGRTMLCLTKSDQINDANAVSCEAIDADHLETLQEFVAKLEDECDRCYIESRNAPSREEKFRLMDERDKLDNELREAQRVEREFRIALRSKSVTAAIRKTYTELTSDPAELPVFCIGNSVYKKHQMGYKRSDPRPPTMSVAATMIPELRKYLLQLPAEGKINDIKNQVFVQFPAIIEALRLYTLRRHMDQKEVILAVVRELQLAMPGTCEQWFGLSQSATDFQKHVLGPMMSLEYDWTTKARALVSNWERVNNTRLHLSMLQSEGNRHPRGGERISWNDQLIAIARVEMDRHFYSYMREALPELTKNTRKPFADGLRGIVVGVKAHEHYKTMGMIPFLSYLQTEARTIRRTTEVLNNALRKEIGDMFRDITTDSPKNFVAKAMSTVYAKSAKIKGKAGAVKQRLHFFQQEVTRTGGVWHQAHDLLHQAFVLILKAHKTRIETAAGEFFERIERTFEMMCPDETEESEEEIALRKELSSRLEYVERQLNNEVKPKLLEILGIPEPED